MAGSPHRTGEGPAPAPVVRRAIDTLFDVSGRTILVTGGARGLGRILSEGFVDAGARVYISSRTLGNAEKAAREISERGPGTCLPLAGARHRSRL